MVSLTIDRYYSSYRAVRPENASASTDVMELEERYLDLVFGLDLNIVLEQSDYAKKIMSSYELNDAMSSKVKQTNLRDICAVYTCDAHSNLSSQPYLSAEI